MGPFWVFFPNFGQKWIFLEKKALSVFKYSNYLPSCRKSETTDDPFQRKMSNWQTYRKHWFYRNFLRTGPMRHSTKWNHLKSLNKVIQSLRLQTLLDQARSNCIFINFGQFRLPCGYATSYCCWKRKLIVVHFQSLRNR